MVQCRDDNLSRQELLHVASEMIGWFESAEAKLLLFGHAEEAAAMGAHGVHLGSEDLPRLPAIRKQAPKGFLIGYTAHTVRDGYSAAHMGADFVTLGPIFDPSRGNPRHPALGTQEAGRGVAEIPCPVFASGGITPFMFGRLRASGVRRVALSGSAFENDDVRRVVEEFLEFWEKS